MRCKICKRQVNGFRGLANHIRCSHKINSKEYYDKFLKKAGEGICPVCGKETPFKFIYNGYCTHCSRLCTNLDAKVIRKREKTCFNNFGVKSPLQSKEIQEKFEKTSLKHFKVRRPQQAREVKAKIAKTNYKRYGSKAPAGSEEVKAKMRASCLEKFGFENAACSPEVKSRIIDTMQKRYKVSNPMHCPEIRKRCFNSAVKGKNTLEKKS